MLKQFIGNAAAMAGESIDTTRNNAMVAAAATARLPQAPSNNRAKTKKGSLADDDAASEAGTTGVDPSAEDAVDEDQLAGSLLVQFPTYGTQSQALNHHSSAQWQEKTADWLLGGTSSIPTPRQQLQQRQQQQQQQQQQMSGNANSGILPTVDEQGNPSVPIDGNGAQLQTQHRGNRTNDRELPQKLVNSREWSVDEQLLWKSHKFATRSKAFISEKNLANHTDASPTTTLKEYDVPFRKPVLEDPSRDFLAAYYYHVGVMPKAQEETKHAFSEDDADRNQSSSEHITRKDGESTKAQNEQLQSLVREHSSPYHLNNGIRRDISSFQGIISSLPNLSEEKEGNADHQNIYRDTPNHTSKNLPTNDTRESGGEIVVPESTDVTTTSIAEVAWMPDRLCKACYSCETPFTVFRRRHHCRICGQVFCNTCSGYFVPASSTTSFSAQKLLQMMPGSPIRLGSSGGGGGTPVIASSSAIITPNTNTSLQLSQASSFGANAGFRDNDTTQGAPNNSKITLRTCKMCFDQVTARQEQQKKKLTAAEEDRKRQQQTKEQQQQQGTNSGIETVVTVTTSSPQKSSDSSTKATLDVQIPQNVEGGGGEESSVLRQWSKIIGAEGIASHAKVLQGEKDADGVALAMLTKRPATASRSTSSSGSSIVQAMDRSNAVEEGNRHLGSVAASHLEQMTTSLLESDAPLLWETLCEGQAAAAVANGERISHERALQKFRSKWVNKLMSLATRCCATVDTNVKRGDMLDVRPYVKLKVIPGGSYDECAYISGILFRKTGTSKQMPREIINPKIMLLSGGIEFMRTTRMASLDTLLEQEDKYIEMLVNKILTLEPDILMVGKGVSRRAQDQLLKNNVQLLQQVKPSLLNRISRQTGATIISSTDHIMNQFGAHVLGKCQRFRFIVARDNESWVNGESKTVNNGKHHIQSLLQNEKLSNHERQAALAANMLGEDILDGSEAIRSGLAKRGVTQTYALLEGCPKHLGCTVVLRGANKAALKQIKNVFRFLVGAAYNMKLEMSYLKERCARLRPDYKVEKRNLFSSSFCVDYGSPPNNRKVRPWNGGANNEGMQRSISGQITAFDHQSILITSVWMTEKTQCCPAEVKGICYYSVQDVSLGQFLRDSCFNLSLKCQNPSCKKSVLDHSLSFVHNDGLINITVDHMDEPLPPAPTESDRNMNSSKHMDDDSEEQEDTPIATWTYCNECGMIVTPLAWLSDSTWKYSFGKFLESFFYNRDTIMNSPQSACSCNLQRCTTLYFGCGSLAAKFTYERIRPFGVFVRKSLPIDTTFHRARALQHLEKISMASSSLFVKFDKHIEKVAREARSVKRMSDNHHLQTVISELNRISNEVDHAAKTLQEKIASVSEKCLNENEGIVDDAALFRFPWHARRFLFMLTSAWNEKLSAAGQAIVAMKKLSSASQRSDSGMGSNVPAIVAGDQNTEELNEGMRRLRQLHEVYSRYNLTDIYTVLPTIPGNTDQRIVETEFDDDFEDPDGAIDFAAEVDADVLASRRRLYSTNVPPQTNDSSRLGVRTLSRLGDVDKTSNPQIEQTPGATVRSAITRFFQRGGRERDPYVVNLGEFHEGRPRLEPGMNGIVVPVIDEQLSTVIAYSLSSKEYDSQFQNYTKMDNASSEVFTGLGSSPNMPPKPPPDGNNRNRPKDPNQNPPKGQSMPSASNSSGKKGIERRMLVRNKSHIKHTFRDLDEKGQNLCKFVCTTYWATQFHAVREAFLSQSGGSKDSASDSGMQSGLDVEKSYILSLSSAFSWAASGGKSGASFARTADDRFVIKCISRTELQMFLDCAPAYFEYLSKAFFHGLPTVLCKIVGVYQIGYHNRVTGKRSMEQVAVMQNIFYNKNITKTFDLKGSLRGRFAARMKNSHDEDHSNPTNSSSVGSNSADAMTGQRMYNQESGFDARSSTVDDTLNGNDREDGTESKPMKKHGPKAPRTLLDGDFLEASLGRPMPMHDRAKEVFHMSILNDTLFLSIINVLDYSILVGIDEEKMELVVGIIDFMRQYDILKQMERVGKSLPMVVGSEAPTIIQPPLYKARFTNAMERYFMTVPSKWTTI